MRRSYEHWMIRGRLREHLDWSTAGEPYATPGAERELAVVIFDTARGWMIETTLDDELESIVSLRLDDRSGLAQRDLHLLPLGYIRDAARSYIETYASYRNEGFGAPQAIDLADRDPGEVELSPTTPTLEQFAVEWTRTAPRARDGERLTRREVLARRYGRSLAWVDKRTREARDLGLIEEKPRTGRPRASPSQASDADAPDDR